MGFKIMPCMDMWNYSKERRKFRNDSYVETFQPEKERERCSPTMEREREREEEREK